jgi:glycosyltransferase involved in cell wall biosynthesis
MADMIPEISVLIIARNAAETIGKAVQSMLDQSMGKFELLVYDDASEDGTAACIQAFSDVRIRLISGKDHKGIPAARNILLREARGRYIAWLDADDWSFPQRLKQQWNYLEEHLDTDLLFTWIEVRNGGVSSVCMPADGDLLRAWLMLRNPFAHSTMMARNFFASEGLFYDETMARAQDYELYLRLAPSKKFAMCPEILVSYDARGGAAEQMALPYLPMLMQRNLSGAGIQLQANELNNFLKFLRSNEPKEDAAHYSIAQILSRLEHAHWPLAPQQFCKKQVLLRQWFRLFRLSKGRVKIRALGTLLLAGPVHWWTMWRFRVKWK